MIICEFVTPCGKKMHIRPALPSDCPAIAELEGQCFTQPWSQSSFEEMFKWELNVFLVACGEDGAILGYALGSLIFDTAEVLDIASAPIMRKQGIGSALLTCLHNIMKQRGIIECFLEVREHNTPAIMLYEKMGYFPISVRKNYYKNPKENAIVMHKIF